MRDAFSCDTSVVLGSATADGSVVFAKNSDRSPNECQPLTHIPGRRHRPGDTVRCQYLEIPQVAETCEVIGSRPYWLWGFEIGVNEWGVAIGNEAVHTREPYEEVALIGMDMVRLGLERARTADEAVRVIGELVERYGQGGSCEAGSFRTYQNSFIVADPVTAWVLETAGHRWIAERVEDRAAISNLLMIHGGGDRSSPGIEQHARDQGWVDGDFDFARAYQDP
ncbi:MAG TPA: C69 family dipeptidase, partial [Thermomicrobiales bacterium]|nr:C69 family dipeptidase [Thermomicrobiales bacterium]